MVKEKLLAYLRTGKLHYYRALWNLQTVVLRNLQVESVLDLIPGMESDILDPAHYSTEEFMYQNGHSYDLTVWDSSFPFAFHTAFCCAAHGHRCTRTVPGTLGFRRIDERDASGWTPLCYAALGGSPLQVSALLEARADANDAIRIKGHRFELSWPLRPWRFRRPTARCCRPCFSATFHHTECSWQGLWRVSGVVSSLRRALCLGGPQFMNFGNNATALSICIFLKHNEAAKACRAFKL